MAADLRSLFKNSTIYSVANILGKLVGFLMLPVYTRFLTPADYGTLELLTLTATVIHLVVSMKLGSALPRLYFARKTQQDKDRLVSTLLLASLAAAVGAACLFTLLRFPISRLVFHDNSYARFFIFIFANLALEVFNQMVFTYLRVIEKALLFAALSLVQLVTGLASNIIFIVHYHMGVQGVLYSMIISNAVVFVFLSVFSLVRVGFFLERKSFMELIHFSLPLIPASIGVFILNMGDRFLLARFVDTAQIGLYALGYKFAVLLGMFFGMPFLQAWEPKRAEIFERGPEGTALFERVFIYAFMLLAYGGLGISVLIRDVIAVVAAPQYQSAWRITPLVVIGYLLYLIFYVLDLGIFLKKRNYWYPIINGIAAAVNVGLNLILIPKIGIMGAAIATPISFGVMPLLGYFISQRLYPVHYDWFCIARITLGSVACYFLISQVNFPNHYFSAFAKGMCLLLFPIVLLLLKCFTQKEITEGKAFIVKAYARLIAALAFTRGIPSLLKNSSKI